LFQNGSPYFKKEKAIGNTINATYRSTSTRLNFNHRRHRQTFWISFSSSLVHHRHHRHRQIF